MKNSSALFMKILLSIAMLLQFSCGFIGVRDPAAKKIAQTITVDEVFSIKTGTNIAVEDFQKNYLPSLMVSGKTSVVTELSKDLPDDVAFRLQFEIIDDQYVLKILHSKNAFRDADAAYELSHLIKKLSGGGGLQNPLSLFEMYYNAHEGDPIALDNFLKIRENNTDEFYGGFLSTPANYNERLAASSELRSELTNDIKELKKQRKILAEKRKALMDKLDKAPDAKQFKTLVAKNDRKGVADLLQKYLPYEEMAPFEKRFWDTYLEVIRNPVPMDQRILIYRGLADDFIHIAYDGAKEAEKEEALKEGKTFVMSTVLVKNQGSWNRRLRSLESMNGKFIATIGDSNEFSQSARISTIFLQHSADPKGSPFLSFTPRFHTAQSFGSSKMMMGLIDPRLLHFNYVSRFPTETEFLLPLVTFPDEMAGFWHWDYHAAIDRNAHFDERLKIHIENEYGKGKSEAIIKRIKKNTDDFFAPVLKTGGSKVEVKGGTMAAFYKKFAKAKDFKPAFTPDGNITCKDLLKLFWAVP